MAGIKPITDVTYLRVADKDDLTVGAPLVEGVDLAGNGVGALPSRVTVSDTTARRLSAAGRVGDGLGGGAGVGSDDHANELAGRTESGGYGGLSGAEDVEGRALGGHQRRLGGDEKKSGLDTGQHLGGCVDYFGNGRIRG